MPLAFHSFGYLLDAFDGFNTIANIL